MNILISGVASRGYLYGLADAIRVVRVDFQNQDVVVLALPRDLWVSIPEIADQGITEGKLNQAYFYGTEGMGYYSGAGYGSGLLAETLQLNYGYRADHYVAVNLYSFRTIIDSLGGIDIYLAGDSYIKSFGQPKLFLKAGSHRINGYQAEMLARNRITIGDFGRINNQTVILRAVAARLISPAGIQAIPNLIDQFSNNVLTDLSPDEISQLICLAGMIDQKEDIDFYTLPEDLMAEGKVFDSSRGINTSALIGDEAKIREFMEAFQNRAWPEDE
jgi:LCP family protein required for cell wall assembly